MDGRYHRTKPDFLRLRLLSFRIYHSDFWRSEFSSAGQVGRLRSGLFLSRFLHRFRVSVEGLSVAVPDRRCVPLSNAGICGNIMLMLEFGQTEVFALKFTTTNYAESYTKRSIFAEHGQRLKPDWKLRYINLNSTHRQFRVLHQFQRSVCLQ